MTVQWPYRGLSLRRAARLSRKNRGALKPLTGGQTATQESRNTPAVRASSGDTPVSKDAEMKTKP